MVNMLLLLAEMIDPDVQRNAPLVNLISRAFGFDENDSNHGQYRSLRKEILTEGRESVHQRRNFSNLNTGAALKALVAGTAVIDNSGKADFNSAVDAVLKAEGYLSNHKSDRGGLTKYGISQNAHPDINVASLTKDQAVEVYRTRYWNKIDGIESMSKSQALVAFDAAVNHGVSYANKLVRETNGDVTQMLAKREQFYDQIVEKNSSQAVFRRGWGNRIEHLALAVTAPPFSIEGVKYASVDPATQKVGLDKTPGSKPSFAETTTGSFGQASKKEPVIVAQAPQPVLSLAL